MVISFISINCSVSFGIYYLPTVISNLSISLGVRGQPWMLSVVPKYKIQRQWLPGFYDLRALKLRPWKDKAVVISLILNFVLMI